MSNVKSAKGRERPGAPLRLAAVGLEAEFTLLIDGEPRRPEDVFGDPRGFITAPMVHRRGTSYHLPTGGAIYFDTGVIELATPIVELERGCMVRAGRSLWDSLHFVRAELDAWEGRTGSRAQLAGFSAHYNVSANGRGPGARARLDLGAGPARNRRARMDHVEGPERQPAGAHSAGVPALPFASRRVWRGSGCLGRFCRGRGAGCCAGQGPRDAPKLDGSRIAHRPAHWRTAGDPLGAAIATHRHRIAHGLHWSDRRSPASRKTGARDARSHGVVYPGDDP